MLLAGSLLVFLALNDVHACNKSAHQADPELVACSTHLAELRWVWVLVIATQRAGCVVPVVKAPPMEEVPAKDYQDKRALLTCLRGRRAAAFSAQPSRGRVTCNSLLFLLMRRRPMQLERLVMLLRGGRFARKRNIRSKERITIHSFEADWTVFLNMDEMPKRLLMVEVVRRLLLQHNRVRAARLVILLTFAEGGLPQKDKQPIYCGVRIASRCNLRSGCIYGCLGTGQNVQRRGLRSGWLENY